MADIKVINLPTATTVNDSDYLLLEQTNASTKTTVSKLLSDRGVAKLTDLSSTTGASKVGTTLGSTVQAELTQLSASVLSVSNSVSDLSGTTGASKIGTSSGKLDTRLTGIDTSISNINTDVEDIESNLDYISNINVSRAHKWKVIYELTHQFAGYTAVVSNEGYNYLYATGHTFDHTANELWVAYQADGGDSAQWYVVYDLSTLALKTYFKCGVRWTKSFNLKYTSGKRYLYGRAENSYLAIFDVTVLPSSGGAITASTQPKSNIGALFSSVMGEHLLVAHRGQTTNTVTQFNTYLCIDATTFEHKHVYRLNTVSAGDTDGNSTTLYKTQGLCFTPSGLAIARGGYVGQGESATKSVDIDFRSIQGMTLLSSEGSVQISSTFDPFKAMTLMQGKGYTVNRFETEGLNYDSDTQKLTTIWHINGNSDSKFLIVEGFSSSEDALDFNSCSVDVLPNVQDIASLWRSDQNSTYPHDPVTGATMSDVTDLCNMMIRYDQRELSWYTTNFSTLTFNGSVLAGSLKAELFRGTNTTFFLFITGAGTAQKWLIQISGTTYTYTSMATFSQIYRFDSTHGIFSGTGSPEGSITASIGSTYHRFDGSAGTSFYVKESGSGNTGWIAK